MPQTNRRQSSGFFSLKQARSIATGVSGWFELHQRDLNFRKTLDPYAIMVAEFMLQQTTAMAVQPYFTRFLQQFPTVQALAAASEEQVMALWAGLGYYRRARQLHATAQAILEHHNGVIPSQPDILARLPGIGRYTAGSIAASAYDIPAAILEANTIRVFARLAAIDGTIGAGPFTAQSWQVAQELVDAAPSPRLFNMGAMELGSLVCRPQPKCTECPVQAHCKAYQAGIAAEIPRPRPRPEPRDVAVTCLAVQDSSGAYLVRKIPEGQWHAGLWEFPTSPASDEPLPAASYLQQLFELTPDIPWPAPVHFVENFRYQVTRHRVTLALWKTSTADAHPSIVSSEMLFLPLEAISGLPLGSTQKKIMKVLTETDGLQFHD